jgi:hypothetical protein
MTRRERLAAAAAAGLLLLAGCATMGVSSFLDRSVDFSQYHTYSWGPADALPTGDPRLDSNPFFKDRLEGGVDKALAARGFGRPASGASPDLLLHYHASVTQRLDVNGADRRRGYCYDDCQPRVTEYEEGTLVLDAVDARTNKVVWRGWAKDTVDGVIEDQALMERKIDEAVRRMMALFPARP